MLTAKLAPPALLLLGKVLDAELTSRFKNQWTKAVFFIYPIGIEIIKVRCFWAIILRIELLHFMVNIIGKSICCKRAIQIACKCKTPIIYRPVVRVVFIS